MVMYGNEESIYGIIPPKEIKMEKPPMYRSKHSGTVPPTASTFGHAGSSHPINTNIGGEATEKVVKVNSARTFGKSPGAHQPDPQSFAKKGEKATKVVSLAELRRDAPHALQPSVLKVKTKPSLPKLEDKPIMNLVSQKNFIVANAVETILAAPQKSSRGAAKDFLNKQDYGKVPTYLQSIKKDIQDEYEYIAELQKQEQDFNGAPKARLLSDDERFGMIQGLKAKWEKVNTDYQATTHLTKLDTTGKVRRKEQFESDLTQIEKDIEKLNKKNIYVDPSY